MAISQKCKKVMLFLLKLLLLPVERVSHRLYMKFYLRILAAYGCNLKGTPRYIGYHVVFDDYKKITIGDRVVISDGCHLLTHDYSYTTALLAAGRAPESDIAIIRGIHIGNNVFIGKKTILCPNTSIGNNCIIGAGSVIRGKIEDNSVVMGNPALFVCNIKDLLERWDKKLTPEQMRQDKK